MSDKIETEIKTLFTAIRDSIMTSAPDYTYEQLHQKFCDLVGLLDRREQPKMEDFIWEMGGESGPSLGDLIIGAYWHYTEWHDGQDSETYMALSAIGTIYSPGMTSGVEQDTGEEDIFDAMHLLASAEKERQSAVLALEHLRREMGEAVKEKLETMQYSDLSTLGVSRNDTELPVGEPLVAVGTRTSDGHLVYGKIYCALKGLEAGIFPDRPFITVIGEDGKTFSCHAIRFIKLKALMAHGS